MVNFMKNFQLVRKENNGKEKWFIRYFDGIKIKTKTCRNCNTQKEAKEFANQFFKLKENDEQYLIKNIANDMYLSESEHLKRLERFGKNLSDETLFQKREFIKYIIRDFGEERLDNLKISKIENFLLQDDNHSGSWKNSYLGTFCAIYDETIWKCDNPIKCPIFQRFARNSRKPDIFSEKDLKKVLDKNNYDSYKEWLIFYLTASCGLRLGEIRAIQARQILICKGILVIDGFLKRNNFRTNYNKKGSINDRKIRCVPIPDKVLLEIAKYIAENKFKENDFLFVDKNDRLFTNAHLELVFRHVLKRSGINTIGKRYVPHSLRFTYVSRMRSILSVEDIRKIVGHTSTEMTEYYTRLLIDDMCDNLQPARKLVSKLFDL